MGIDDEYEGELTELALDGVDEAIGFLLRLRDDDESLVDRCLRLREYWDDPEASPEILEVARASVDRSSAPQSR